MNIKIDYNEHNLPIQIHCAKYLFTFRNPLPDTNTLLDYIMEFNSLPYYSRPIGCTGETIIYNHSNTIVTFAKYAFRIYSTIDNINPIIHDIHSTIYKYNCLQDF